MNKTELYELLDISHPGEFKYYENLAALVEEDSEIETELIADLLSEIDIEIFGDLFESYFDQFLDSIPDEETDLFVTVENVKRIMLSRVPISNDDRFELNDYSDLFDKFRRWYSLNHDVISLIDGSEHSIRDARYDYIASNLLGYEPRYDFRAALTFDESGYDYKL